ncbi:hypothetical protein CLFE_011280 [Clostridium felsineum DSM 794]|nr:hypothetical protein CLFE_011280 [Clostridium felsineum DSM 794]
MKYKTLSYIKKHEVLTFVVMTYVVTWIIWGIVYLSYIRVISKSIYNEDFRLLLTLGAFIPTTVSIFFTGFLHKREGIKKLLNRLTKWKYNFIYYILVICFYPFICYIVVSIYKFFGCFNLDSTRIISCDFYSF